MFRRQRGPETLAHRPAILLPHQSQHLQPKLFLVGTVRSASGAAVLQARRPFQQFQSVVEDISGGNSIYNSLQVTLDAIDSLPDDASAEDMAGLDADFSDADQKKVEQAWAQLTAG